MKSLSLLRARTLAPPIVVLLSPCALAQYQGQELWRYEGTAANRDVGRAVASAGDVNNDGYPDVLVGDPYADGNAPGSGVVYVLSGLDGSKIWTLRGDDTNDYFGAALDGIGDVDGDNHADFIVGLPGDGASFTGSALVYSGATATVLWASAGDQGNDGHGSAVSGAGDVDNDGVPDFLVGEPSDNTGGDNRGMARVRSGATGVTLYTWYGDDYSTAGLGASVDGAGDVDLDGFDDLIVAANYSAFVFSGQTGLKIRELDAPAFSGTARAVACVGDVNGDGYPDQVVGHGGHQVNGQYYGRTTVYSGFDGSQIFGRTGLLGSLLGYSADGAGDFNGDGTPDVLAGGYAYNNARGVAVVYSGTDGSTLATFFGDSSGDRLGESVAGVGDTNGDGFDEVVVGAPQLSQVGQEGIAFVFSGGPDTIQPYCDSNANSTGNLANLSVSGSTSVAANDLALTASPVPDTPGIFFFGPDQVSLPFGDGIRCVGGQIQRLPVSIAGSNTLTTAVDNSLPSLNGALAAGSFWNFQAWFRDTAAGGSGFNTSGAVQLHFHP